MSAAAAGLLVWSPVASRPAAAAGGAWTWPVAGPVTVARPFVPPAHRYGVGHRGADVGAVPGVPVRAAGHGRVTYAGRVAGRGVVVVRHGALRTTYEPVTATVPPGSVVARGEVIGVLGAGHAGCPAPACLHWGLRRGDDYLDPVRLVERGPVRLLPVGAGSGPGAPPGDAQPARPPPPGGSGQAARAGPALVPPAAPPPAAPPPAAPPPAGDAPVAARAEASPGVSRPVGAGLTALGGGLALAAAAHRRAAGHGRPAGHGRAARPE